MRILVIRDGIAYHIDDKEERPADFGIVREKPTLVMKQTRMNIIIITSMHTIYVNSNDICPPDRSGDLNGSTATTLKPGLRFLMNSATPGDRPAGADARHEDVHLSVGVLPDLLRRGLAVDLGVGGVLELLRHEGVRAWLSRISCAFSTAPFMPCGAGVSTSSAPKTFRSFRRSMLKLSGMVMMQR